MNTKIFIFWFFILILDIIFYYFISYITRTHCKKTSSPYMLTPKLLAQLTILLKHLARTFSLQILNYFRYTQPRRVTDQQVNVVPRYMALDYLYLICQTYFSDKLTNPLSYVSLQYRFTILRNPHYMYFYIILGMRSLPEMRHATKILKLPPKGVGFHPSQ